MQIIKAGNEIVQCRLCSCRILYSVDEVESDGTLKCPSCKSSIVVGLSRNFYNKFRLNNKGE